MKFLGVNAYLNCSNVEKSKAFYEGLGFKLESSMDEMNMHVFRLGTGQILIGPSSPAADEDTRRWLANKPWGVGLVLCPPVDDVDELYKKALAIGAEIEMPPTDMPWGSRMLSLSDPDGYSYMFDQEIKPARRPAKKAAKKTAARKAPAAKKTAAKKAAKKSATRRSR